MSEPTFSHLDPMGHARMVDVTPTEPTHRRAVARCKVFMSPETTAAVALREMKKGDVIAVARVAGIQAAKRTWELIPLSHQIALSGIEVAITATPKRNALRIEVTSRTTASTGAVTVRKDAGSVGHIKQY